MKNKLDKYIEEALYYFDLPGLVIVAEFGGEVYENAAGYRDFLAKEPLAATDIFHMASVSKLFTGTAILQLEEKGLLSVDDKLTKHLPWIKVDDDRLEEITIKHMLTHTSGLADVEDYHWDMPETDQGALKRYCCSDEVSKSKMLWSPNENKFRYSNIAYEILGCLVAEKSDMTFEEYIKENIFIPLGMYDSEFLTFERNSENMAKPHKKDENKHIIKEEHYPYNRAHGPSSTLTTNGADIGKWAKANLDKQLLSTETYEKAWTEYATVPNNGEKMGLSWFMRRQGGYDLYGHEGTDNGFRSSFWICPELNGYIAVMANITGAPVKKINKQVFKLIMDL